jgi:hypothetical protein
MRHTAGPFPYGGAGRSVVVPESSGTDSRESKVKKQQTPTSHVMPIQIVMGLFQKELIDHLDAHPEDCFIREGILKFFELAQLTEDEVREELSLRVQLPF